MAAVNYGDTISLGGVDMVLAPVTQSELEEQLASRTRPTHLGSPALTLFLLTVFQLLTTLQLWMGAEAETAQTVVLSFLGLLAAGWLLFAVLRMMRRSGYEVETLAFFLSTLGFAVIASDNPANLTKQLICLLGGIVIYLIIGSSLMTLTTTPNDLTDGMERLLNPLKAVHVPVHEISMMMSIALRFIPILLEETDKIMKAQIARGADFESGNIIQRAKAMIPLLVPLFISAFRRANDLAMAMEARCYRGGDGRTKMKPLHYESRDHIAYAVVWGYLVLMIVFGRLLSGTVIPF